MIKSGGIARLSELKFDPILIQRAWKSGVCDRNRRKFKVT